MTKEHDEWVKRHFGVDPSDYDSTDPDPDLTQSVDPNASQANQSVDSQMSVDLNAGQVQSVHPDAGKPDQSGDPAAGQVEVLAAGVAMVGPMSTPQMPPPGMPPSGPILDLPPIPEPFPAGPVAVGDVAVEVAEVAEVAEVGEAVLVAAEVTAPLDLIPGPGWLIAGGIILTVAVGAGIWYLMKDNKPVRQASPQEVEQAKANQDKPVPTAQDPNTGQPLYTPGDGEYTPAIDPATGEPFEAPGVNQGQAPVEDPSTKDSAKEPNSSEPMQMSGTNRGGASYPVPQRDRVQLFETDEIVSYIYHAEPIPRNQWSAAIDEWAGQGELEHAASELEGSIETREEAQHTLGEDPPHRVRIDYERDLLRAIQKKLSGT